MYQFFKELIISFIICYAVSQCLMNEGTIMSQVTAYTAITGTKPLPVVTRRDENMKNKLNLNKGISK